MSSSSNSKNEKEKNYAIHNLLYQCGTSLAKIQKSCRNPTRLMANGPKV